MAVFNEDLTGVLILTKLHGPTFLIGKDNFPGGHVESGETPDESAVREIEEETGIIIDDAPVVCLQNKIGDDWELHTYAACVSDDVLKSAKQLTDEPIRIVNVKAYIERLILEPEIAAHDIKDLVLAGVEKFTEMRIAAEKSKNEFDVCFDIHRIQK